MLLFLILREPNDPFFLALFAAVLVIFAGLILMLALAYESMGTSSSVENRAPDFTGRTCAVRTSVATRKFGLGEIEESQGVVIQIRTPLGVELHKGDRAVIVGRLDDQRAYLVHPA